MYSYEKRIKAVKLYIQYDRSVAAVRRELGYPSPNMLLRWYAEYVENGDLRKAYSMVFRGSKTACHPTLLGTREECDQNG